MNETISILALVLGTASLCLSLYNRVVIKENVGKAATEITNYVVDNTTKSLNDWAVSFGQSTENVINMTVEEKIAAAMVPAPKKK